MSQICNAQTAKNKIKEIVCQIRQAGELGGPESGEVGGKAASCSLHIQGKICRQYQENDKTAWQPEK